MHCRASNLLCTFYFALHFASVSTAAERSPLVEAAKNSDRIAVRALIAADVNAVEPDGTTALHWASYRDEESADAMLRAGAKVNSANDLGATPLWIASLNGSAAMVRRLLQAGANPNAALLLGETPMSRFAFGKHRGRRTVGQRCKCQRTRCAWSDSADVGGGAEPP